MGTGEGCVTSVERHGYATASSIIVDAMMARTRPTRARHAAFAAALWLVQAFVSAAIAADPAKTLHVALTSAEMSFDPQFSADAGTDAVIDHIYESMLDYDYLARPLKLVPRTLESMPAIEGGGATYVFRLQRGIHFTPDPAFGGRVRELTAADQAYALKRLLDPAVKSPWAWLIEGKVIGSDEARAKAVKTGKFDYDAPIAGLEVVDRYTLRIRLKEPDLRFLYIFAIPNTAAVAREVVERYGADFGGHPVGTGPYLLGEYQRSSKIVLVANPGYREVTYAPAGPIPPDSAPIAAALKGRKLPLAGRVEITIIEEGQAVWLAFANGELDVLERVPADFIDQALANGKLRPELAAKGIVHEALLRPNTRWTYFNMEDSTVGGYTPEKIALRRAIGMGYDMSEYIRVILKGRGVPARGSDTAGRGRLRPDNRRRPRSSTTRRERARCSTDSATATATATAIAKRPTENPSCSNDGRRRRPLRGRKTSNGRRTWTRSASRSCSGRIGCRNCARWRARARCRCAPTAGTPTIRTPRISCSSCMARTWARRITRASACPNSTSSTRRPAACRIHRSARGSSTG